MPFVNTDELPRLELFPKALSAIVHGDQLMLSFLELAPGCEIPEHSHPHEQAGLGLEVGGIPPLAHFGFTCDSSQAAHTLFTQIMLQRGFLASKGFYATYAHQDHHVEKYLTAVSEAFGQVAKAVQNDNFTDLLQGPVAHTGFRRLT